MRSPPEAFCLRWKHCGWKWSVATRTCPSRRAVVALHRLVSLNAAQLLSSRSFQRHVVGVRFGHAEAIDTRASDSSAGGSTSHWVWNRSGSCQTDWSQRDFAHRKRRGGRPSLRRRRPSRRGCTRWQNTDSSIRSCDLPRRTADHLLLHPEFLLECGFARSIAARTGPPRSFHASSSSLQQYVFLSPPRFSISFLRHCNTRFSSIIVPLVVHLLTSLRSTDLTLFRVHAKTVDQLHSCTADGGPQPVVSRLTPWRKRRASPGRSQSALR